MEAKDMNIRLVKSEPGTCPRLKVVGVGGAGGNAINEMVKSKVRNVQFVAVNTDEQALSKSRRGCQTHHRPRGHPGHGGGFGSGQGPRSGD